MRLATLLGLGLGLKKVGIAEAPPGVARPEGSSGVGDALAGSLSPRSLREAGATLVEGLDRSSLARRSSSTSRGVGGCRGERGREGENESEVNSRKLKL